SVNLEIPTESGLKLLAPEKNRREMDEPMGYIKNEIIRIKDEKKVIKSTPKFAPAGQSTQMIIGASAESDQHIIQTSAFYYKNFKLKRVYYSGYIPISFDKRLPILGSEIPVIRENRLYQSDWLMRFYGFKADEIVSDIHPN